MSEAPASSRVVHFNDIEVDLEACELHRQGRIIRLPREPARILATFLERPGQVIRREEFQRRIWPSDSALEFERDMNSAIDLLRKALDDSGVNRRSLETVSDRDYRFTYPDEPSQEGIPTAPTSDRTPPAPIHAAFGSLSGSVASHFRIHEEIQAGGMGIVYRAQDTRMPRWVALKFPTPELATNPKALQRFEREARTASSLNHPNICTIYEVDHHEGLPFIAMELLEGETLERRLSGKPLAMSETVRISSQVAGKPASQAAVAHQRPALPPGRKLRVGFDHRQARAVTAQPGFPKNRGSVAHVPLLRRPGPAALVPLGAHRLPFMGVC